MEIRYKTLENKKVGTHSFYAQPDYTGTFTMDEIIERACGNTSIEPSVARAAIELIQDATMSYLLRGYRCQIGYDFLTIYPNIRLSVKDYQDEEGNTVVATADMLNANAAESSLDCTVHPKFTKNFAFDAKWRKSEWQKVL